MSGYREIGFNRRANYDYEIVEKIEAGIVLKGSEVKYLRMNKINGDTLHLPEAYAGVSNENEIFLYQMNIPKYSLANRMNHEPKRNRKLLLKKRQILRLLGLLKKSGLTLVPISLYFNENGYVKLSLGLGKGKKEYDKRATIKEREWNRAKHRILKNNTR